MYTVNQISDYTIFRLTSEDNSGIANLKLQKILYYIQAWHLAFNDEPLFDGRFQAWIHGPVNRDIYDRFKDAKYLYSLITTDDILDMDSANKIDNNAKLHVNYILESYAQYTAIELEMMTHREDPWIIARQGLPETARCENEIDENLMREYYKQRLQN